MYFETICGIIIIYLKFNFFYVSDFLASRDMHTAFEVYSKADLGSALRLFYSSVRKQVGKNGEVEEYGRVSYLNMRSGIQRFLVSPPYNLSVDLRRDPEFQSANQVLDGKLKLLKRQGQDVSQHKSAINPHDVKKM